MAIVISRGLSRITSNRPRTCCGAFAGRVRRRSRRDPEPECRLTGLPIDVVRWGSPEWQHVIVKHAGAAVPLMPADVRRQAFRSRLADRVGWSRGILGGHDWWDRLVASVSRCTLRLRLPVSRGWRVTAAAMLVCVAALVSSVGVAGAAAAAATWTNVGPDHKPVWSVQGCDGV